MKKIFGQTDRFAIEVDGDLVDRASIVGLRVWIKQKSFGQIEDEGVVGVFVSAIFSLTKDGGVHELEEWLNSDFELKRRYCALSDELKFVNAGESFDDFYVLVGRRGGEVVFIWTLIDEPFYRYPEYQYEVNQESVDLSYFRKVVCLFMNSVAGFSS